MRIADFFSLRALFRSVRDIRWRVQEGIPDRPGARTSSPHNPLPAVGFCCVIIAMVFVQSLVFLSFPDAGFSGAHPAASVVRPSAEDVPFFPKEPTEATPEERGVAPPSTDSAPAEEVLPAGMSPPESHPTLHQTDEQEREYFYTLHGTRHSVRYTMHEKVYEELESRFVRFDGNYTRYYHAFLDDPLEEESMDAIVAGIRSAAEEPDDQLRCAVSLVQAIPYGRGGTEPAHRYHNAQYPYETLYENAGVCEDKSLLLAAILRRLGYGIALFKFDGENHMALGVRCPDGYDYRGTGYAFIETTVPGIPTDDEGKYVTFGKLTTMPEVIPITEGKSFDSVQHEWGDAAEWNAILAQGHVLDSRTYARWKELAMEYGMLATVAG